MNEDILEIPELPPDPFERLNSHPIGCFVSASVPLRIMAILKEYGEPTDRHWEEARDFADVLGEKGDVLLFGGKKGEAASLANTLAQAIAVMSFLPGGIRVFGQRFEAKAYERMMKGNS